MCVCVCVYVGRVGCPILTQLTTSLRVQGEIILNGKWLLADQFKFPLDFILSAFDCRMDRLNPNRDAEIHKVYQKLRNQSVPVMSQINIMYTLTCNTIFMGTGWGRGGGGGGGREGERESKSPG